MVLVQRQMGGGGGGGGGGERNPLDPPFKIP